MEKQRSHEFFLKSHEFKRLALLFFLGATRGKLVALSRRVLRVLFIPTQDLCRPGVKGATRPKPRLFCVAPSGLFSTPVYSVSPLHGSFDSSPVFGLTTEEEQKRAGFREGISSYFLMPCEKSYRTAIIKNQCFVYILIISQS